MREAVNNGGYGLHSDEGALVSNINVPISEELGGGDESNDVHLQIVVMLILSNVKDKNAKGVPSSNSLLSK